MCPISDHLNDKEQYKFRNAGGNTLVAVITDPGSPLATYPVNPIGLEFKDVYAEAASVVSGVETDIVSYTIPVGKTFYLERVKFSGDNIAKYRLLLDGVEIEKCATWFSGPLFSEFNFGSIDYGKPITAGQVLTVKVLHVRPTAGDFQGRIQGVLEDV